MKNYLIIAIIFSGLKLIGSHHNYELMKTAILSATDLSKVKAMCRTDVDLCLLVPKIELSLLDVAGLLADPSSHCRVNRSGLRVIILATLREPGHSTLSSLEDYL